MLLVLQTNLHEPKQRPVSRCGKRRLQDARLVNDHLSAQILYAGLDAQGSRGWWAL